MIKAVCIIAGGAGTRLWPASVKEKPKHFLSLGREKSLLAETLHRALLLSPEILQIVTLQEQADLTLKECRAYLKQNQGNNPSAALEIIPEPRGRNTAPAIAASCAALAAYGLGGSPLLVLPADHLVGQQHLFAEDVEKASVLAARGFLVTFGVPPLRPETGYGYIEGGLPLEPGYTIASFREKPDKSTAEEYLKKGGFYWNSGMFLFKPETYLEELENHAPEIFSHFSILKQKTRGFPESKKPRIWPGSSLLGDIYERCPADSIDYAVMEKTERAAVIPARFNWSDIGSWDEIALQSSLEGFGKGKDQPPVYNEESGGCYVYSDLPVALCGVSDLIVVVKNGSVLICRKGESQKIKRIVERL